MKKFWIVLLALGLVAGFAMSASAADVKFGGQYYVYGIYNDNPTFVKSNKTSQAYYHQRLRIQTEFKVAEGLSLVTRLDALEKPWGYGQVGTTDAWRASNSYDSISRSSTGATGARAQENIEFERAYIDMTTKIGRFNIGYQDFIYWGTMFLDTHATRPGIKYIVPVGPLTVVAALEKTVEQTVGTGYRDDADNNIYDLGAIYKFGAGDAGLLYQYADMKYTRPLGYKTTLHILNPYAKMKFGPVYFEAEGVYGFGKWVDSEIAAVSSVDAQALGLYLHAKADIGPAYVGGILAYMSGDDISTTDKKEGTFAAALLAGQAWDPCLIMWNDGLYNGQHRAIGTGLGVFFDNAYFAQVYGGFKPVKQADIMLSVTWAKADQDVVARQISKDIGWEIDLVAKYKIFDNLEYMIGAGYLLTGDYFKMADTSRQLDNNYMLVHKLTLSF
ncbi:MAG: hypothetical protein V1766_14170 [Pseudomonadota bacterium]